MTGVVAPVEELVVAPRFVARAGFLERLGLTVREHPVGIGEQVVVDGSHVAHFARTAGLLSVIDALAIPTATAQAARDRSAGVHLQAICPGAGGTAGRVVRSGLSAGRSPAGPCGARRWIVHRSAANTASLDGACGVTAMPTITWAAGPVPGRSAMRVSVASRLRATHGVCRDSEPEARAIEV
ncbi:hypothetical protein [Streptomyces aureus]|uniref:Uncharacterized protein n=1 Tax=Streptomyces aureus TaxID=193461 RepID=A0ABV4SQ14_9ACTN